MFAAGSLSQVFKKVADAIRIDQDIFLETEFGSTSRMAKLIQDGSSCDIFAAADMVAPQKIVDMGRSKKVIPFTRNDMVAVARKERGVTTDNMRDFIMAARSSSIGISDPVTQPCGANAIKGLSHILPEDTVNRVVRVITGGLDKKKEKAPGEKSDYTSALAGDIDLLVVFRTTGLKVCAQLGSAEIVELPPSMAITAQYGMTVLNDNPVTRSFVDYLQTEKVKSIFKECGFK